MDAHAQMPTQWPAGRHDGHKLQGKRPVHEVMHAQGALRTSHTMCNRHDEQEGGIKLQEIQSCRMPPPPQDGYCTLAGHHQRTPQRGLKALRLVSQYELTQWHHWARQGSTQGMPSAVVWSVGHARLTLPFDVDVASELPRVPTAVDQCVGVP